jgi:DNA-binding transcriptional regulator LsrR (DeoR family)
MNKSFIPENVKSFLQQNIDSVAQWEGLLLLRTHPDKEWTTEEAARHLYITEQEVVGLLRPLVARGLIEIRESSQSPLYRFHPKSAELSEIIKLTAEFYRQYLIPVTHLIHSVSKNKVQQFADAFRMRKD